jgi:2-iminobutanoate/2-iminopropanoate deaminase
MNMKKYFILFALILLTITYSNYGRENNSKKIIFTEKAPKPIGPYSQAVLAGYTLYLSGQIGLDMQTGKMVEGGVKNETELIMNNIKNILETAGYKIENIVKTTIYLSDIKEFSSVNSSYATFFKGDYPARETVQVSALPMGAHVEISVIAVK